MSLVACVPVEPTFTQIIQAIGTRNRNVMVVASRSSARRPAFAEMLPDDVDADMAGAIGGQRNAEENRDRLQLPGKIVPVGDLTAEGVAQRHIRCDQERNQQQEECRQALDTAEKPVHCSPP